jgi:hypothetical protein
MLKYQLDREISSLLKTQVQLSATGYTYNKKPSH